MRGQTKADEAKAGQSGTNVSCGRAGPAKSKPALSLPTVLSAKPPPAAVSFSKTNLSSAASSSRTKKKYRMRLKLKRSSTGFRGLQLSAEEKPESLLTKKGTQAAKAEEHLITPILLLLLESLGACTETGESANPLHAPTELQLLVQDVEAGPQGSLVASSSNPGRREFSASAVNSSVSLFEEDISDYMRRVGDNLELKQEHQEAPAVDDEEPATTPLARGPQQSLDCPTPAMECRYLPTELQVLVGRTTPRKRTCLLHSGYTDARGSEECAWQRVNLPKCWMTFSPQCPALGADRASVCLHDCAPCTRAYL